MPVPEWSCVAWRGVRGGVGRAGLAARCWRWLQSRCGAGGQRRGSPEEKPQEILAGGGSDLSGLGRWRTFCFCMSQRGRLWALLRWKGGRGGRGRDPPLRGAPRAAVAKGKGEPATPPQVLQPQGRLLLWPLLPPPPLLPLLPTVSPRPPFLLLPPLSSC